MTKVYLDIETRSRQNLKKVGVHRYVTCPDFRILMCSWAVGDEGKTFTDLDEQRMVDRLLEFEGDSSVVFVAHNAHFERTCFGSRIGTPDPRRWHDTMAVAGERGLPMSLAGAADTLGCTPKDSAGKALINLFCKPRRDGGFNDHSTHPLEWLDFIAYCEQDVDTMREIDLKMGGFPSPMESRVWVVDQKVNDRGIEVDLELASVATAAVEANKARQRESIELLTGIVNPGSTPQMMRWAEEQGLPMQNCQADTILGLRQSGTLTYDQATALELRGEYALISYGKFGTALATAVDGRIRGGLNFFGAHTGRWSGSGVQLQNLPRQSFDNDVDAAMAIDDLLTTGTADPQDLKRMVRSMFVGPLTVFDYASIEARVIAWMAGERWALEAFLAGRDIYIETMNRMGLKSRFQGKVAVLALGYQGSIGSLRALMGTGAYLSADGAIVQYDTLKEARAAGADPYIPDEVLLRMVRRWRKTNSRIVDFWYTLDDAIAEGGRIGPQVRIRRKNKSMAVDLPSGRSIFYHGLSQASGGEWSYKNRNGMRVGLYGGRLAENITQAVARDLLAEALVRLDDAGYPIVLHVHDEVVLEGAHDLATIESIMTEVPKWAKGLPIAAGGYTCLRYRK